MLEPKPLFKVYDPTDSGRNKAFHFAHLVTLMGSQTSQFLKRNATSAKYWDVNGKWKVVVPIPPPISLESRFTHLIGSAKYYSSSLFACYLSWMCSRDFQVEMRMCIHG